jgi:hypothetical protein
VHGTATISGGSVTWTLGAVPKGTPESPSVRTLALESEADPLSEVISSPDIRGSTSNLFQEISLGVFPGDTVPSAGIATADVDYDPGFEFTAMAPQGTCPAACSP